MCVCVYNGCVDTCIFVCVCIYIYVYSQASVMYSAEGSNVCPDGYVAIDDAATCEALADANGWGNYGSASFTSFTHGCSKEISGFFTGFNMHPTGGVEQGFVVVCRQDSQARSLWGKATNTIKGPSPMAFQ